MAIPNISLISNISLKYNMVQLIKFSKEKIRPIISKYYIMINELPSLFTISGLIQLPTNSMVKQRIAEHESDGRYEKIDVKYSFKTIQLYRVAPTNHLDLYLVEATSENTEKYPGGQCL